MIVFCKGRRVRPRGADGLATADGKVLISPWDVSVQRLSLTGRPVKRAYLGTGPVFEPPGSSVSSI